MTVVIRAPVSRTATGTR